MQLCLQLTPAAPGVDPLVLSCRCCCRCRRRRRGRRGIWRWTAPDTDSDSGVHHLHSNVQFTHHEPARNRLCYQKEETQWQKVRYQSVNVASCKGIYGLIYKFSSWSSQNCCQNCFKLFSQEGVISHESWYFISFINFPGEAPGIYKIVLILREFVYCSIWKCPCDASEIRYKNCFVLLLDEGLITSFHLQTFPAILAKSVSAGFYYFLNQLLYK